MEDAVLLEACADGTAIITLNRPRTRNCLSAEVRAGLFAAWHRFEHDPALRIAVLTGAGPAAFCAGGDLREMVDTRMAEPPLVHHLSVSLPDRSRRDRCSWASLRSADNSVSPRMVPTMAVSVIRSISRSSRINSRSVVAIDSAAVA